MAISPELQAQILRYHHVEKWRAGTIARQLGIHHHTVHGVLAPIRAGAPWPADPTQQDRPLSAVHP